jgi:hypothetical protein
VDIPPPGMTCYADTAQGCGDRSAGRFFKYPQSAWEKGDILLFLCYSMLIAPVPIEKSRMSPFLLLLHIPCFSVDSVANDLFTRRISLK